jgi:hypothetical protein
MRNVVCLRRLLRLTSCSVRAPWCGSAASSADAAIAALAALTSLLRITLGDVACGAALDSPSVSVTEGDRLPELLAAMCQQSREDGGVSTAAVEIAQSSERGAPPTPTQAGELRVHRSAEWVRLTAERIAAMLPPVFTVLSRHVRSSVRAASATAAAELIGCCGMSLQSCASMWLECLFALAHDPWPQVAALASKALESMEVLDSSRAQHASRSTGLPWLQLRDLLLRQTDAFTAACGRGEQDVIAAARQQAGAIYLAGPARFTDAVLMQPALRRRTCLQLTHAFAMAGGAVRAAPALLANDAASVIASTDGRSPSQVESLLPRRHRNLLLLTSDEVRAKAGSVLVKLLLTTHCIGCAVIRRGRHGCAATRARGRPPLSHCIGCHHRRGGARMLS